MPRFKIQIDGHTPVIAGPEGSETFNISVHDGFSREEIELPKLVVMTFEDNGKNGSVMKHWVEETLDHGARVQIEVLDDGEVDPPAQVESEEQPLAMCWYCFKTANQVGYLVSTPKGTVHICDGCVELCVEEIRRRREKEGANA